MRYVCLRLVPACTKGSRAFVFDWRLTALNSVHTCLSPTDTSMLLLFSLSLDNSLSRCLFFSPSLAYSECGAQNEIRARDNIQCRDCGYRILYKKRTKRSEFAFNDGCFSITKLDSFFLSSIICIVIYRFIVSVHLRRGPTPRWY
jgi:DNA-directed RNA polymerase subunit RPC12/RpoP